MRSYKSLVESLPSKTIVFAFGRFNPPTVGHQLIVQFVKKLAGQARADHLIYASKTQDAKKNPLSLDRKLHYLQLMFPGVNFIGANDQERTPIEVVKALNRRYKNLIMVAGSDRAQEFSKLLNKYNGIEYNYDSIKVISAGDRDPDAEDTSGISASKMRTYAAKGDFVKFKQGLPGTLRDIDARRLMNDVREGVGLESIKEQVKINVDALRESYYRGDIYNVGDIVESISGQPYEIVKRGTNYLLVKDRDGKLESKWLSDVVVAEQHTQVIHRSNHKEINHGDSFKLKIGKEHHQKIIDLEHGDHHVFKCMDNKEWHAVRVNNDVHFVAHPDDVRIHSNFHPKIPHSQFTGKETYKEPPKPWSQTVFAKDL